MRLRYNYIYFGSRPLTFKLRPLPLRIISNIGALICFFLKILPMGTGCILSIINNELHNGNQEL